MCHFEGVGFGGLELFGRLGDVRDQRILPGSKKLQILRAYMFWGSSVFACSGAARNAARNCFYL